MECSRPVEGVGVARDRCCGEWVVLCEDGRVIRSAWLCGNKIAIGTLARRCTAMKSHADVLVRRCITYCVKYPSIEEKMVWYTKSLGTEM